MHPEVRKELSEAILQGISHLRPALVPHSEHFLVPVKTSGTGYKFDRIAIPSLKETLRRADADSRNLAAGLHEALRMYHADHLGSVGTEAMGMSHIDGSSILLQCIHAFWQQTGGLDDHERVRKRIIEDTEHFVDSEHIALRFCAPVSNLDLDHHGTLNLGELTLAQLCPYEHTQLHSAGPFGSLYARQGMIMVPWWGLMGTFDDRKLLNAPSAGPSAALDERLEKLDRCITAMRMFRNGPVGYDNVLIAPSRFSPFLHGPCIRGTIHPVPPSAYAMEPDEVGRFHGHLVSVLEYLDPSLELAAARLSDTCVRSNPRDKLVDAVIGLESLLSTGRTELRFRFALNYALLETEPEVREEAFRLAQDIYDLRSALVHGSALKQIVRIGQKEHTLSGAATLACNMLRTVLQRFVAMGREAPYKSPEFWTQRYFGSGGEA